MESILIDAYGQTAGLALLQEAHDLAKLQDKQRDERVYAAAVAARAATGAAAANLRKRCHQCEACLSNQASQCVSSAEVPSCMYVYHLDFWLDDGLDKQGMSAPN